MNTPKIEKGIPMPQPRDQNQLYPWAHMKVGDSFFVPGLVSTAQMSGPIYCAKAKYGFKFACRYDKENKGVRVWRVK